MNEHMLAGLLENIWEMVYDSTLSKGERLHAIKGILEQRYDCIPLSWVEVDLMQVSKVPVGDEVVLVVADGYKGLAQYSSILRAFITYPEGVEITNLKKYMRFMSLLEDWNDNTHRNA
jgi:hypothetical protein